MRTRKYEGRFRTTLAEVMACRCEALGCLVLLNVSACAETYEVSRVENVVRAAAVWKDRSEAGFSPHVCLEFSTAAHELRNRNASLKVPLGDAERGVDVGYASTASLAQIYTVSDIMQFGHATLYRLCEAAGNRMLSKQEYATLVKGVLDNVHGLLELQLTGSRIGVLQQIKAAQSELMILTRQLQELDNPSTPSTVTVQEDREVLAAQRSKALDRYHTLLKTYDVTTIFEAADPVADVETYFKKLLTDTDSQITVLTKRKTELTQQGRQLSERERRELDDIERKLTSHSSRKAELERTMASLKKEAAKP